MSNAKRRFDFDEESSGSEFEGEQPNQSYGDEDRPRLGEVLEDRYSSYQEEDVDRLLNRIEHEHEIEQRGATPFHRPGHIGPLMYEYLNMVGVEASFVSGLQHTKSSLTKTVQQRVDEINTLLRGVGGFNRQIKASFSRSAVVYLEQEDPHDKNIEKVIFTVNLGDFELRFRMDEGAADQTVADGRTLRRLVWDEAVNTLAEIVSNTGLKPKYVKNDKNSAVFQMKQYLLGPNDKEPDEYFTFDLRYVSDQSKIDMEREYVDTIDDYNDEIEELQDKASSFFTSGKKKKECLERCQHLIKDRDFYIATHPDPREMDYGLVFSISVNTLKDYGVTKDKMQVIMTKYILALSNIATDKSLDQQVSNVYQYNQSKPKNFQDLASDNPETANEKAVVVMKDELKGKRRA